MQGGQGRGLGRQGYNFGPRYGMANNYGAVTYGGTPGYGFSNWVPYSSYHMQTFMPIAPVVPRPFARGSAPGSFVPLGVQGAGILKRPAGPPQGQNVHGRSIRHRGHSGRSWAGSSRGGRARKNLTKEALDAELDEYRMKVKKVGGEYLDAELDEYMKKKDRRAILPEDENKDLGEGSGSGEEEEGSKDGKTSAGRTSSHHEDGKQSADNTKLKGPTERSSLVPR